MGNIKVKNTVMQTPRQQLFLFTVKEKKESTIFFNGALVWDKQAFP